MWANCVGARTSTMVENLLLCVICVFVWKREWVCLQSKGASTPKQISEQRLAIHIIYSARHSNKRTAFVRTKYSLSRSFLFFHCNWIDDSHFHRSMCVLNETQSRYCHKNWKLPTHYFDFCSCHYSVEEEKKD